MDRQVIGTTPFPVKRDLPGDCPISTDYWTFNGQTRGSNWQSGYTLKFWNQTDGNGYAIGTATSSGTYHDWTFQYVEMEGTNTAGSAYSDEALVATNTSQGPGMQHGVQSAPVEVEVAGRDIEHIDLRMIQPFDVSVQLGFDDAKARELPTVQPRQMPGQQAPPPNRCRAA